MNKKILIWVGGIALVLIIFIWQVAANLDSIVASVIEDVGSEVLKTKVSVSGVEINLKASKAGIDGLTIANPEGYSDANLFDLEGIEVGLDLKSMNSDVLVFTSIRIQNPKAVLEVDETGGNNMQTLLDNIGSSTAEEGETPDEATEKVETRMIIDLFEFSGGLVKATTPAKPGEVIELKLPPIKMTGIGRAEGGVTAEVVMKKVTNKLVNVVIEAAVKAKLDEEIEKQKAGFMDKLTKKLKGDD
jgi:hypothetical protein